MLTAIIFAVPIFILVTGTVAALAFSAPPPVERLPPIVAREREEVLPQRVEPGFLQPAVRPAPSEPQIAALLDRLEALLRKESAVAAAFAANPSSKTLWVN